MAKDSLLLKGFTSGWIQKFFTKPFDPLCVMLAMRSKLLLDAIDEMGHSYNLMRYIGYGWIDFGEIPGEIPGDPGDYYPPDIDDPIIITPPGGGGGTGGDGGTGGGGGTGGTGGGTSPDGTTSPDGSTSPDGTTSPDAGTSPGTSMGPTPGASTNPIPGQPGYVAPKKGQPGYVPPWHPDRYIARLIGKGPYQGHGPGSYPDGRRGGPHHGGGTGLTGGGNSMSAPVGMLDQGLWTGPPGYAGSFGASEQNCCVQTTSPFGPPTIGYATLDMPCESIQSLTIEGAPEGCTNAHYTWSISPDSGTIAGGDFGAIYTAPAGGVDCLTPVTITLSCDDAEIDSITINISECPTGGSIGYTTPDMLVNASQDLVFIPEGDTCGTPSLTWAIIAGDGSITGSGTTVSYQAPSSNVNCLKNPTIQVSCGGVVLATVSLAIHTNTYQGIFASTYCWHRPCPPCVQLTGNDGCCYRRQTCTGTWANPGNDVSCNCCPGFTSSPNNGISTWLSCAVYGYSEGLKDHRTTAHKEGGCCPSTLL